MITNRRIERAFQAAMRGLAETDPGRWDRVYGQIVNTLPQPLVVPAPVEQLEGEPPPPPIPPPTAAAIADEAARRRVVLLLRSTDVDAVKPRAANVPTFVRFDQRPKRKPPVFATGAKLVGGEPITAPMQPKPPSTDG